MRSHRAARAAGKSPLNSRSTVRLSRIIKGKGPRRLDPRRRRLSLPLRGRDKPLRHSGHERRQGRVHRRQHQFRKWYVGKAHTGRLCIDTRKCPVPVGQGPRSYYRGAVHPSREARHLNARDGRALRACDLQSHARRLTAAPGARVRNESSWTRASRRWLRHLPHAAAHSRLARTLPSNFRYFFPAWF